jgi:hypothetical protein
MNITTIHGEMDDSVLEKRTGINDTDTDSTEWVEYWYEGQLVHRSVHVHLKEGNTGTVLAAEFN